MLVKNEVWDSALSLFCYFVAKVRGEVFAHFHAVAVKRHSSMWNWLFGLQDKFISFDVKINDDRALHFAYHPSGSPF
jgi:hypothetical protein